MAILQIPRSLLLLASLGVVCGLQTQCDTAPILSPLQRQAGTCAAPIDDTNFEVRHRGDNTIWTEKPYCLYPRSIGSKQKFCVYTSSVYNLNTGISVVATPEGAAEFADRLRDPLPPWEGRAHLAYGGELTPEQQAPLPYKIVSIPGMGKGVVATRNIAKHEVILESYPNMIIDNEFLPSEEDKAPVEGWRVFQRALDQLQDKERFLKLAKSKPGDIHVVEDIVRTNAFGISIGGRAVKALYPEISRMNHDCNPNTFPQHTNKAQAMKAVAMRNIMEGEPITISYITLGMPTIHRQRSFYNWGFNCTCAMCAAPREVRDKSDERRERMADLYYAMDDESIAYDKLLTLTREFVQIMIEENLEPRGGEYFQGFMRFFYRFGDLRNALKYAQLSLDISQAYADPEGGFCGALRKDIAFLKKLIKEREERDEREKKAKAKEEAAAAEKEEGEEKKGKKAEGGEGGGSSEDDKQKAKEEAGEDKKEGSGQWGGRRMST